MYTKTLKIPSFLSPFTLEILCNEHVFFYQVNYFVRILSTAITTERGKLQRKAQMFIFVVFDSAHTNI